MLRRSLPLLSSAFLCLSSSFAQPPASTTLTLTSDAAAMPVHTVIHLTATVQSASPASGSITFLDNGQPLITLPLDAHNLAVLAIASLPQGSHTLTATYTGDAAHSASTSAPVALSVTPLPASLTLAAGATTTYAGTPITVTASGLPTPATGAIAFTDGASTLTTANVPGASTSLYQALGDSITYGVGLAPPDRYVNLFAAHYGFALSNYGYPGSVACDLLPTQILPNNLGATQTISPLSSLMIGTNDADFHPNQSYLPIFQTCHQAALAWLAIPREYKVLPGDPALTVLSGTWTSHPGTFDLSTYGTLFNQSGSGTARVTVISTGTPIYLWYLMGDNFSGTFTLALDGTSTGATYSTHPATPINSIIAPNTLSIGYALLRLPASAGPHTLDITVQSGTVGILAAAIPPSPGSSSVHPTVLVSDLPSQLTTNPNAAPATQAQYTQAIQQDVTLLAADGLDLRPVPTQHFMLGTAAEMADTVHPNILGDQHLAAAFESVFAASPLAPYSTFSNSPTSSPVTLNAPGPHSLVATYSGDAVYAATAAPPLAITVQPQTVSATTLSTSATRFPARTPVTATANVSPASATGTVTFYDGTIQLAQLPLTSGTAAFTSSNLSPGLHSLTASYSGDSPDTASASPALAIEIDLDATTLTLASIPAGAPYGTSVPLTVTINPTAATGPITFLDTFTPASQSTSQIGAQQLTLGQATLGNGTASLIPASLLPGTHSITASYPGDPLDLASTSAAAAIQITALATFTTLRATPAILPYGSSETLTATVSPATATGTVTIQDSISGTITQATLANGTATFSTSTLIPGPHTLIATYSGDAYRTPSTSPSISIQVNPAASTIIISPVAATYIAGSPLTLTATLTPPTATGTFLFRDATSGTLGQATVANGTATFTTSTLSAAAYSITAIYSGDTFNAPSTSAAVTTKITLAATTTTLAALPPSILYATPTPLTATVAPATATGTITFTDTTGNTLGTAILANGTASLPLATLSGGPHTLHALYSGDPLDAPSTSAAIQTTVTPNSTSTTLALALANVPVGTPVTFNIRVTSPLTSSPSGTVTVRSGTSTLASGPLASSAPGVAYATLSANSTALGLGSFPITASYSGDPADASSDTSAAPALSFTILPIPTTLAFTLSATQIPAQAPITLAATVVAPGQTPTGSISFFQNNTLIATVPLTGAGTASTILKGLAIGGYKITATFTPTGLFAAASAPAQDLTVSPPISIALTPSAITGGPASTKTSTLVVTPLFGFASTVQATCQPSVTWVTCTIDPVPAIATAAPVSSLVHITVAANTLAANHLPSLTSSTILLALLLPFAIGPARRRLPRLAVLLLAATSLASLTGCAEGGTFGNVPPGAHTVQINVIAGGATFTTTLTVNVTQ